MNKGRLTTAIEIQDLTISYGGQPVIWDLDLTINAGSLAAVAGPNGAGKSSLFRAIIGSLKPIAGSVKIFGHPFQFQRNVIGYVPQRSEIDWNFPIDVLDVVLMGTYGKLGWFKRPGRKELDSAMISLEKVGMEEFVKRQIGELSGGQQQRVFLARALAQEAEIYLMDEPFQGVDASSEKAIINILKMLQESGKTVIVIHHDLQTVVEFFDEAVLLNVRLIEHGKARDVINDKNIKLAFGGKISFTHPATTPHF